MTQFQIKEPLRMIEALRDSIAHWTRHATGRAAPTEEVGSDACACCNAYTCTVCPVLTCEGSPWKAASTAYYTDALRWAGYGKDRVWRSEHRGYATTHAERRFRARAKQELAYLRNQLECVVRALYAEDMRVFKELNTRYPVYEVELLTSKRKTVYTREDMEDITYIKLRLVATGVFILHSVAFDMLSRETGVWYAGCRR